MIQNDPAAPFEIGNRVRLLNGPLMTVARPIDEDREILCYWWDDLEHQLNWVYAPEALLVHAQAIPMTTDPGYFGEWKQRDPRPRPSRWLTIKAKISGWLARSEIRRQ